MDNLISKDKLILYLNDWRFGVAPDETTPIKDQDKRLVMASTIYDCMLTVENFPTVAQTDGDLVSRQALDECKELMTDINGETVYAVRMEDIRQLPSVAIPHDGDLISRKDVMGCIGQTSLHFELARKLRKMPTVAIPSADPKWIPVSERLPEEGKDVLACFYTGEGNYKIMVSRRSDYNYWSGVGRTADMVAWMPLPEPYKAQKSEE